MYFPVFEIDRAYHISQRRYERFLSAIADNIDIVTASVYDLNNGPKIASVVPIHCQTFDLKPIIFACRERGKPVLRDQHLMLPKSFSCVEVLAALQPDEHTFMDHPPLS